MAISKRDDHRVCGVPVMVVQHVAADQSTAPNSIAASAGVVATFLAAGLTLISALQKVPSDDAAQQQIVVPAREVRTRQS